MKLRNYNKESLTLELVKRLNDISQRERIVLNFPFGENINRIEIYCSETAPNDAAAGAAMCGEKFCGIVSLQVFTDYTNKPQSKSSYSYKKELLNYIPTLVEKVYKSIEKQAAA